MRLGCLLNRFGLHIRTVPERRIGFYDDAVFLAELQRFRLREARMHLQLVDGRRLAGFVDEPLQMLGKEIRNAAGPVRSFLLVSNSAFQVSTYCRPRGNGQ